MQKKTSLLAVLFGSFNLDNIHSIVIKLQQEVLRGYNFFPTIGQNITSVVGGNQPLQQIVEPLIEFVSTPEQINIRITRARIDIIKTSQIIDDTEFLNVVRDIQKKLLSYFEVKGARIAYVVNFSEDNALRVEAIKDKVMAGYFYKAKEVFEWNARSGVEEIFQINNNEEKINVITSLDYNPNAMKIVGGKLSPEFNNSLMCSLDINTNPNNTQKRIDANFIDEFYTKVIELVKEIEEKYSC
ncbi:MAG: hypothetical protein FWE37_05630 [Spirochaetaceae bacterium]|nr:hypothetical protein [Spirochaetaceae bacterium]